MIGGGVLATRAAASGLALGILVCLALALGARPAMAEACPNQQLREESDTNPATHEAYSLGLPDCRAYEMVSPLEKQGHDVRPSQLHGYLVAPNGNTVGFESEGNFANSQNYGDNFGPRNSYLATRGANGWTTSSALPPSTVISQPWSEGLLGSDFSPDLSTQVSCGNPSVPAGSYLVTEFTVCAMRSVGGSWSEPTTYVANSTSNYGLYRGASSDLSHIFLQAENGVRYVSEDVLGGGIYEITGLSPTVRLVNVDNEGHELGIYNPSGETKGPRLGNFYQQTTEPFISDDYHAISDDGRRVFFTARPFPDQLPHGEKLTVYARLNNEEPPGPHGARTVVVSAQSPSECTGECASSPPADATFQGASADGSKVFFTTTQRLLNGDKDETNDLYEYDFAREEKGENPLILVSAGESNEEHKAGEGANVIGVIQPSSDGSRIFFVASGVLTEKENANKDKAVPGKPNLYAYDTTTGETEFIAVSQADIYQPQPNVESPGQEHLFAQATPDGRYLVFATPTAHAGDTNCGAGTCEACNEKESCPEAVYRYDFETGELTWVSHNPEFNVPGEGDGSFVSARDPFGNAEADVDDWSRAISGESELEAPGKTPAERHDGEYIIFATTEKLQQDDNNHAADVYEWHDGKVTMISDGQGAQGVANTEREPTPNLTPVDGMSASGSDIFFTTSSQLVKSDTDGLRDLYDARIGGGFPAPAVESCAGDECQGAKSGGPSAPGATASSSSPAGGNLAGTVVGQPPYKAPPKAKPLTNAQLLAKALKTCRAKPKKKRGACEAQARKKYAPKKTKKVKKAKSSKRSGK